MTEENKIKIIDIHLSLEKFYESFMAQVNNSATNTAYRLVWKNNELESQQNSITKVIKLGISSRNRKIYSKPMLEILYRICSFLCIEIIILPDDIVKNNPVEKWPIVDAFLCFYAQGYPLDKAWNYVTLRKPYVVNEILFQKMLFSRNDVYHVLMQNAIPVPEFISIERDMTTLKPVLGEEIIEDGDTIILNGKRITKPFVEKPFDAENHNITIYFPDSIGGGCQKLFRKMGNRSSFYCKNSKIRRDNSYLYEEFVLTDGADVKVYCVGPEYAYAEARKSPALDGKVERDHVGKEMRYPVILASHEKYIARRVVELFKQNVCGIDMLRTGNKCYVCDVNGLSFVKKSTKYYEDCAYMISTLVYDRFFADLTKSVIYPPKSTNGKSATNKDLKKDKMLELVSVIAIIRHGDRTPKQKMKMLTRNPEFFGIFHKYGGKSLARIKLKKPSELQDVLDVTNKLLKAPTRKRSGDAMDNPAKLLQMKYVLEMYGEFLGFNRKVQIKSLDDKRNKILEFKFRALHPQDADKVDFSDHSLLLILKWGGELTEIGRMESEEFGQNFAKIYPHSRYFEGTNKNIVDQKFRNGLLRLHSTYRHSMKVFASDEGRVQLTAASFARGMLSLEGQLAPILVHLVKCDKDTTKMLDSSSQVEFTLHEIKKKLNDKLSVDREIDDAFIQEITAPNQLYLQSQLREIGNPVNACKRIHELITELYDELVNIFHIKDGISYLKPSKATQQCNVELCHSETYELMVRRWGKLVRDFKMQNNMYDMSLIPDIYDCARYDYFHNSKLNLKCLPELYDRSKQMAHVIIAQEYGITQDQKFSVGKDICTHLINKLSSDLKHNFNFYDHEGHILDADAESSVSNPHRRVRTRLYFTSESHMYGLMNVLRYGGLFDNKETDINSDELFSQFDNIGELDFLSHILIVQYEDTLLDKNDENRFKVEIFISPGNKRSKPITKSKQLTRPLIDKGHTRSRSLFQHKSTFLTTKDDNSATYLMTNDMDRSYKEEPVKSESQSTHMFDLDRLQSSESQNTGESFSQAMYQFRKPQSIISMTSNNTINISDYLFGMTQLGPLIPRSKIINFFDSLGEKNIPDPLTPERK